MIDPDLLQTYTQNKQRDTEIVSSLFMAQSEQLATVYGKQISVFKTLTQRLMDELDLFHLFEAHVKAGKVSEELWTEISRRLEELRAQTGI